MSILYPCKQHCLAPSQLSHYAQHILMYDYHSSNILLYILLCNWIQLIRCMEAEQNHGLGERMQDTFLLKTKITINEASVAKLTTLKYKIFSVSLFLHFCKQNYFMIRIILLSRFTPGKIVTSVFGTETEFNNFKFYQLTNLFPLQVMSLFFYILLRENL